MDVAPTEDDDPIDQAAAEEAEKYLKVFEFQADLARAIKKMAGILLYRWPGHLP